MCHQAQDTATPDPVARVPSESGDENAVTEEKEVPAEATDMASDDGTRPSKEGADAQESNPNTAGSTTNEKDSRPRKPTRGTEPFEKWERDEMEKLLGELCGHLGRSLGTFAFRC